MFKVLPAHKEPITSVWRAEKEVHTSAAVTSGVDGRHIRSNDANTTASGCPE